MNNGKCSRTFVINYFRLTNLTCTLFLIPSVNLLVKINSSGRVTGITLNCFRIKIINVLISIIAYF